MYSTDRLDAFYILGLLQRGAFVAFFKGDCQQATVGFEGPGVVRAAEELAGVALSINGDLRAFVRTPVMQYMDLIVRVAYLNNRLTANLCGEVVTFVWGLALVSDKHPGVGKQVLHFQLINRLAGIYVTVYLMAVKQTVDVG